MDIMATCRSLLDFYPNLTQKLRIFNTARGKLSVFLSANSIQKISKHVFPLQQGLTTTFHRRNKPPSENTIEYLAALHKIARIAEKAIVYEKVDFYGHL